MRKVLAPLIFLCIILLLTAAVLLLKHKNKGGQTANTYSLTQFNDIIPASSTIEDVRKIVSIKTLYVTSFGGVAEFPSNDGRWIQIKLYGPDLIVESIAIVDKPWTQIQKTN